MSTLTLQPDETTGLDTYTDYYNATTNYATSGVLHLGSSGGTPQSGLLAFSGLSVLPAYSRIQSAVLTLYLATKGRDATLSVYGLLRNWVEAEATWNIYSTGNAWQTVGGFGALDRDASAVGSVAISSTGAKDITVTALVQAWVNSGRANYGFSLSEDYVSNNTYNDYVSSSGATSTQRPKLVVEYFRGGQFIRWSNG